MNEAKHTPGPWRRAVLANGNAVIYSEPMDLDVPCSEIAELVDRNGYSKEVYLANARLFAAAPDLLAACEALVNMPENINRVDTRITAARAAIAKAKGGAA